MGAGEKNRTRTMSWEELKHELHSPSVPIEKRIRDMRSSSARVMGQAFAMVAYSARVREDPIARQALIDALEHGTPAMRSMATAWIDDIGDDRVIELIIKHALDANELEEVRAGCCSALGQMHNSRSVRALVELLSDGSADVRAVAACGLGWFPGTWGDHDTKSIAHELTKCMSDPVWEVRWSAALSMYALIGCQALWAVKQAAGDPSVPEDRRVGVIEDMEEIERECSA